MNNEEERIFLEVLLQRVKQRDALLEQIESKLYEMKHIAEQVASSDKIMLESEKLQLNERFTQLEIKVTDLNNELQIFYN